MSKTIEGVEIFAVGTWNGMKFSQDDLSAIAENTNNLLTKKEHKPPVKLGHNDEQILDQGDGQPALGWITNFSIEGDKLKADFEDVPDILVSAIEKKLFKQVSVEMEHIKTVGWIVTAAAVLGADLPAVKTLEDLSAFLSDIDSSKPGQSTQLTFSEPKLKKETMPEETDKALLSENEGLKTQLADMQKAEGIRKFKEVKETALESYRTDVKEGKLAPALVEKLEAHFEEQKENFSEGLTVSAELGRELMEGYKAPLPAGTANDDDSEENKNVPADIKLSEAIAKEVKTSGKSYEEAQATVYSSQPQLVEDYKKFILEEG